MDFQKILWISHSAISSFERCPHLYYYEYEYRNPQTGNRIQITNPYLALGSSVHETIEELVDVPIKERVKIPLKERFQQIFENYRGLRGGFISKKKEDDFYKRGLKMVEMVESSGFLKKPSTSLDSNFPTVDLLGSDVKLVGSIDWVEVLSSGGAHIIDFKTGNSKEKNGSLQLPIYKILAKNNLSINIEKVSYWYLQTDKTPLSQEIGDEEHYLPILREKAKAIKKAKEENYFPCNYSGRCFSCSDYEQIFKGNAVKVDAPGMRKKDTYCIFKEKDVVEKIMEENFLDEREKKIFELRTKLPMEEVRRELRLSEEKSEAIVGDIKNKLKNNLRKQELKTVVEVLKK